jgi:hypothetical protein
LFNEKRFELNEWKIVGRIDENGLINLLFGLGDEGRTVWMVWWD